MDQDQITTTPRGSDWLATAFAFYAAKAADAVQFICDQFEERPPLNATSTPQEVIAYANIIRDRDPGFAADLIAAANRTENGQ